MSAHLRLRAPKFRLLWLLFVFSLPFADLLLFPQILVGAGQPSTFTAACLFLALALAAPERAASTLLRNPISRALLTFLALALLSVPMSAFAPISEWKGELLWFKSLRQVLQLAIDYTCFAIVLLYLPHFRSLTEGVRLYTRTAWFCVAYGAIELLHYLGFPAPGFSRIAELVHLGTFFADPDKPNLAFLPDVAGFPRLRLLASEPAMAGNFLLTIIPFALYFAKTHRHIRWTILAVSTILLTFLSFSAAAVVSLGCGFLLSNIVFVQNGRSQARLVAIGLVALLIVALVVTAPDLLPLPIRVPLQVAGRLMNFDSDISVSGRLLEVRTAWMLFADYPFLGVGIGNWVFHYPGRILQVPSSYVYLDKQISSSGFQRSMGVNNLYFRILCEMGIAGLIAWLYLLFTITRVVRRFAGRFPQHEGFARALMTSVLMLVVNLNAMSAFDKRYWWVVFGFAATIAEARGAPSLVPRLEVQTRSATPAHAVPRDEGEYVDAG
ncbi:MAG: O-antigen ligase family protein [Bryobacteraceae bacterium]|nr:O-antigen ligase family protein [Bryobacteraceae bacterium]